ncbi:MAG: GNAT family N-acetyltransferase [Spirochaetia bacterium]
MEKTATDGTGVQIRPATPSDLRAVVSPATTYHIAIIGEPDADESDFADTWNNPRTDLPSDVWVAVTGVGDPGPEGDVVAYEHCVDPAGNGRLQIAGFVHPGRQGLGLGIGTILLDRAVRRARETANRLTAQTHRYVRTETFTKDHSAHALMENAGLTPVRYFLLMTVQLREALIGEAPPDGIRIASLMPHESFAPVHAACNEIFTDHWGNTPIPYDARVALRTEGERFDRSLWFVARTLDGELAGISLCTSYPDMGWVDTLGVRRPFRGRRVAKALLKHSFAELYRRGRRRIGLGVDAVSLTGPTKLYESVGMNADVTVSVWELDLDSIWS